MYLVDVERWKTIEMNLYRFANWNDTEWTWDLPWFAKWLVKLKVKSVAKKIIEKVAILFDLNKK